MSLLCVAETSHPAGLAGEQRRLFDMLVRVGGGDPAAIDHVGVLATNKVGEARAGYPAMEELLAERRPTKVIALGGTAATVVKRTRAKVAITKAHGLAEWIDYDGGRAMLVSTLSPAMVLRRNGGSENAAGAREWFRDLQRDVAKWVRQDAPLPQPDLASHVLRPTTPSGLEAALGALWPYKAVSCDLETEPSEADLADLRAREHDHSKAKCLGCEGWADDVPDAGFNPRKARIMSLGLGTVDGPQVIVRRPLLDDERARTILADGLWDPDRRTVFHNGKFDLQFLARYFGHHAPVGAQGGDTMLMSYLLDERPVRSLYRAHGLKDISRYRYDVPDYHFDWPRFWWTADGERDWETLDAYHAMDTHQTARLWWDLLDEAQGEESGALRAHDSLLWPASLAMAEAELRGIPVDRAYLEEYRAMLDARLEERLAWLREAIGDPEFNPGSGKEVEALVFDDDPGWHMTPVAYSGFKTTLGAKGQAFVKRNSRKEQLAKLAVEQANERQAEILLAISDWRHDAKARETYAEGLLRASALDGRVHSSFNLAGAVTGRLSSSDPNLQNIPKRGPTADAIRRAFTAPAGWVLMEADYSQLELRVAALLSKDRRFADVYVNGRDIHSEVAAVMFRKPAGELTYMERYLAKAVDFGALYGRSGKAISMGAEMEYYEKKMGGVKWTGEEAQDFVDRFLDGFPQLREWMARTAEVGVTQQRLETPFGRARRFPLILKEDRGAVRRQSFNTPIQSVASDICLSAFIRLSASLDLDEARPLVTIHDSILLEVREDALARTAAAVRVAMMDVPPEVAALNRDLRIPFAVDVKVGRTWQDSEMKETEPPAHNEPAHPGGAARSIKSTPRTLATSARV